MRDFEWFLEGWCAASWVIMLGMEGSDAGQRLGSMVRRMVKYMNKA